jgi:hypothetical protein
MMAPTDLEGHQVADDREQRDAEGENGSESHATHRPGHFRVQLPQWSPGSKSWNLSLLAVPGITLHRLTAPGQAHESLDAKWRYQPKSCLQWEVTQAPPPVVHAELSYAATGLGGWLLAMDWKAWIGPVFGALATVAAAVITHVYATGAAAAAEIQGRARGICAEPLGREVVSSMDVQECLVKYGADYKELAQFRKWSATRDQRQADLHAIAEIVK